MDTCSIMETNRNDLAVSDLMHDVYQGTQSQTQSQSQTQDFTSPSQELVLDNDDNDESELLQDADLLDALTHETQKTETTFSKYRNRLNRYGSARVDIN
eukprot:CAMPEP_0194414616 /NCGR_PEP_ID=MMETSP0176-20130528/13309_1 /TAXON_ID=216777 /ORGANISM="Proboscia alata, Strain PI-D3" /LENGTH=98 /DNA_ID=CAMNT_0039218749 /DNA_START=144 /DNA_END=437 /DNA_ORIENTATION=-